MKRMLIILSLASCMFAGEMGLKAYGGLLMANVAVEEAGEGVSFGMKPGLNFGVQYTKLPVLVGVGMSMRGSVVSMEGVDDDFTNAYTYLDISVLYPYPVGPGAAFAGLDIGINLSATVNSDMEGFEEVDMTENDGMNGTDFGLLFGYTYPINDDMGVSVGYYLGLSDFSGDGGADEDLSADKHNGIMLNVGYALPF